jgi:aminoglycoside phosphotransferase (APT) family kinase protein
MSKTLRPSRKEKLFESSKKILHYINRTHDTKYNLLHRLSGGQQSGAYLVESPEGQQAILKWNTRKQSVHKVEQAAESVRLAREWGWPTPRWHIWGVSPSGYPYQIQDFMPGATRNRLDPNLVEEALRVIDLQAGKAPDVDQNWTIRDRAIVYCDDKHSSLNQIAEYSEAGKDLANLLRAKVAAFRDTPIPEGDLVHGDFHKGNVLLEGERITALVDVEMLGKGSRFHDVATLIGFKVVFGAGPADPVLEPLIAYGKKHAAPGEFEVCMTAVIVDFLGFGVGKNPASWVEESITKAKVLFLSYI